MNIFFALKGSKLFIIICGEMSVDLLANRKYLYEISGIFVYAKNAINAIWRLTLRLMLAHALELKFLYKIVSIVVDDKNTKHICAQFLIGQN